MANHPGERKATFSGIGGEKGHRSCLGTSHHRPDVGAPTTVCESPGWRGIERSDTPSEERVPPRKLSR